MIFIGFLALTLLLKYCMLFYPVLKTIFCFYICPRINHNFLVGKEKEHIIEILGAISIKIEGTFFFFERSTKKPIQQDLAHQS
jgi:ethanolamine transporter EutH